MRLISVFEDMKVLCRKFCPAELKKVEAQFGLPGNNRVDEGGDDEEEEEENEV
jgi:hypothetical protein